MLAVEGLHSNIFNEWAKEEYYRDMCHVEDSEVDKKSREPAVKGSKRRLLDILV